MNYKIKCVGYNGSERLFTIGQVYDVVDTVVTCDDGFRYEHYKGDKNVTIQQVVNWFKPWYEFEIVEDYKVGDHVIVKNSHIDSLIGDVKDETGVITEILHSDGGFDYRVRFDSDPKRHIWCNLKGKVGDVKPKCKDDSLKIENVIFNDPATIVQWSDGSKTVVKCRGEEFDLEKGMAMALAKKTLGDRYWDEFQKWVKHEEKVAAKEPKKSKYLNGKVVCVSSPYSWWTVGKVYDVVDGIITADDGDRYPKRNERYVDYADVRHAGAVGGKHNNANTFVPLEEYKEPLTLKQIKAMDGKKIWLSSMFKYEEGFHDGSCGWYKVYANCNCLRADDGRWYYITKSYKSRNGYKAYYNDMSKEK